MKTRPAFRDLRRSARDLRRGARDLRRGARDLRRRAQGLWCAARRLAAPARLASTTGWPAALMAAALMLVGLAAPPSAAAQSVLSMPGGSEIRFSPGDSLIAVRVSDALTGMAPLPGLGVDLRPDSLVVTLVNDTAAYREAVGGLPPEWSAGVAIPSQGRIVLPTWRGAQALRPGAGSLLRHEWAHVATYRASGGLRAPRWFSEGYAEWAGGWDRSRAWRLRVLLALGRAPRLDSLTLYWPADQAPAESAYLLSASVVEYLVDRSGEAGLAALFAAWRDEGRFETALRRTYGVTTAQLEDDWRSWARDRYGWLFVLTHSSLAWGILALVLAGTAVFRRRYNKDRMARLRAGELPEAPVFWDPEAGLGGTETSNPPRTHDP